MAGGLYYGQRFSINFELTVNSKSSSNLDRILMIHFLCKARERIPTTSVHEGNLPARFVVTQKIPVQDNEVVEECNQDIGMSDAFTIRDCQMSSSGDASPTHHVHNTRFTSNVGWQPAGPGPVYPNYRHVNILFGQMVTVKRIRIKLFSGSSKIVTLGVHGTHDGKQFFLHEKVTPAYSTSVLGEVTLDSSLTARGIRLSVIKLADDNMDVIFSVDLKGCYQKGEKKYFDPCKGFSYRSAPLGGYLPKPFTVAPRVVLYTKSIIFVCGPVMNPLPSAGQRKRCYSSGDNNPVQWQDLGPFVSQILTYLPSAGLLFAIGSDEKSLLMSRDSGFSWNGINMFEYKRHVGRYSDAVNATFAPTSVVRSAFDLTKAANTCDVGPSSDWSACYKGIHKGSVQLVDWSSGCGGMQSSFPSYDSHS